MFEDAGESAKTIDRPEFKRLLEYCRDNKRRVQFVVVYNVTRFARNAHDHAVVRALLNRLGVTLRSVNEPIGDDSVGRLTLHPLEDRSGYRFTGEGTLWPVLRGVVPQNVASPTGTVPRCNLRFQGRAA